MNLLREYVANLDDNEKILIIEGNDEFEKHGVIGDEPIRIHAKAFLKKHNIPDHAITLWMSLLAGECHRYFSELYRQQMKMD